MSMHITKTTGNCVREFLISATGEIGVSNYARGSEPKMHWIHLTTEEMQKLAEQLTYVIESRNEISKSFMNSND